ncbi:molecular chaperone HscC [Litchfieldia salsa]|uniref:Chaperone protein DnaK n=1 Tax=Litchfieldia salsa TaxID=930152 RepID=A0A1H0X0U3_9BACI|nr:molecular chaperone HscC [Litchfieldia salsa]SDP96577.1 molecular chaperone HscC [Litchfieldia salsa]
MTIIGIDLGTTNSLATCWMDGEAILIPNILGEHLTPSVVSIDSNGEILVGQIAKERLITHPLVTASTFKRYMGTAKKYNLGKYTFLPEELSSFIIRTLKEDAEVYLGKTVKEAVISVPAYFNDTQRKATKRAAEMAGLVVDRLINEPTAAALSYGIHQKEEETQFLVFDLGGGTFDVSVMELFEGVMNVKSIAGDNFLGGEDFTNLLVLHFCKLHEIDKDSLDPKAQSTLYKQAEQCKYELSIGNTGTMKVVINEVSYKINLNKSEFERIVYPLTVRLRHPIERALRDASLSTNDLDAVILIGGATKMPIIKSSIVKMFGRMPYTNINPDESVALGTAIQGALKQRNKALEDFVLTDVCPFTLGTEVVNDMGDGKLEDGYFFPIIERNTPIPYSRVERLITVSDNQRVLNVSIFQGESRLVENNVKLGELNIKVPPAKAGTEAIDVRYTYDINGILEVEVTSLSTGERKRTVIQNKSGNLSKKEIEAQFERLKDIKIHPRDRTENRLLLARGERIYEETIGEKRMFVESIIHNFERVLATQNEKEIKKATLEFKTKLKEIEGWTHY